MYNKYKKYYTIHNTDTVAYAMHSGYYTTLVLILRKRRICNNQLMCGSVKIFDYDLILLKVEGW